MYQANTIIETVTSTIKYRTLSQTDCRSCKDGGAAVHIYITMIYNFSPLLLGPGLYSFKKWRMSCHAQGRMGSQEDFRVVPARSFDKFCRRVRGSCIDISGISLASTKCVQMCVCGGEEGGRGKCTVCTAQRGVRINS